MTFLLSARILRDKGIYEYVAAARAIRAIHPEVNFLLMGRRDQKNPQVIPSEDLDSWNQEGVLRYLGEVEDVRDVLSECDVVVLPSYYREGTPKSLLEAASMGKPIITTDSVGCREAVDDGVSGILIPPRDVQSLTEAMLRLIRDPAERRRMGAAGRAKVLREFDEKLVVTRQLSVYPLSYAVVTVPMETHGTRPTDQKQGTQATPHSG